MSDVESSFDSSLRIKNERDGEADILVDPLHTCVEIKDEVSLKSSELENGRKGQDSECNLEGKILNPSSLPQLPLTESGSLQALSNRYQTCSPIISKVASQLEFHTTADRYNSSDASHIGEFTPQSKPAEKNIKKFICPHCKEIEIINSSKTHICRHICENPFICKPLLQSATNSVSFNLEDLKNHVKTQTGDFRCSQCYASFTERSRLIRHVRKHTGEKPFSCSQCSAAFAEKSYLTKHVKTHTGEKLFICSDCPASFAMKGSLNKHMLVHRSETSLACSQISAPFTKESSSKEEIRTHTGTGGKPFSCNQCSASFDKRGSLNMHTVIDHPGGKLFACSHCSAAFAQKDSLETHIRTHTGEKLARQNDLTKHSRGLFEIPFCSQCSAAFACKSDLNRHIMRIHTNEEPFAFCKCTQKSCLKKHPRTHTSENLFIRPMTEVENAPKTLEEETVHLSNHSQVFFVPQIFKLSGGTGSLHANIQEIATVAGQPKSQTNGNSGNELDEASPTARESASDLSPRMRIERDEEAEGETLHPSNHPLISSTGGTGSLRASEPKSQIHEDDTYSSSGKFLLQQDKAAQVAPALVSSSRIITERNEEVDNTSIDTNGAVSSKSFECESIPKSQSSEYNLENKKLNPSNDSQNSSTEIVGTGVLRLAFSIYF